MSLLMVFLISWVFELGEQLPERTTAPFELVTLPVTLVILPTSVEMTPRKPKLEPLRKDDGPLTPVEVMVGFLSPLDELFEELDEELDWELVELLTTEKDWETRVWVVVLLPFFAVAVKV